jgi:hypothetical protein
MTEPLSNADLLALFAEDERNVCGSCAQRTCVSLPDALASFCLGCGAITIYGRRIDVDRRISV